MTWVEENVWEAVLPLAEFIAEAGESPAPLIGTQDDALLPVGGLLMLCAQAGAGKTTLSVDAAFHLASGLDWLGFVVPRPLCVLLLENEGPREPFRRKLERKANAWPHDVGERLLIWTMDWGNVSLRDDEHRETLRGVVEHLAVDVVMADPLGSLGMQGVGSPEDTAGFMALLREAGLGRVAWWLLHHNRKESNGDELDQIRGAWQDHPDALLTLRAELNDRLRLGFPKLRWAEDRKSRPLILDRERDSAGFRVVAEGQVDRDIAAELVAVMADGGWWTTSELGRPAAKGGIGASREAIQGALEVLKQQGSVEYQEGPVGRAKNAKCYRLHDAICNPVQAVVSGGLGRRLHDPPYTPVGGGGSVQAGDPTHTNGLHEVDDDELERLLAIGREEGLT